MTGKDLLLYVFGIGFWAMFIMSQVAFSQRDEAREINAQFDGGQLVCRMVKP